MNEIEKFSKYIRESVNEAKQEFYTLSYHPKENEYWRSNDQGHYTYTSKEEVIRFLNSNHFLGRNGESPEQVVAELERSKQPQPIVWTDPEIEIIPSDPANWSKQMTHLAMRKGIISRDKK